METPTYMNDSQAAYENSTSKQIGNSESPEDLKVPNSLPWYFLFSLRPRFE